MGSGPVERDTSSAHAPAERAPVVVLPLDAIGAEAALEIALDLDRRRATIVLVGADPQIGDVTSQLRERGARVAAFAGSLQTRAERESLVEMIDELFAARDGT